MAKGNFSASDLDIFGSDASEETPEGEGDESIFNGKEKDGEEVKEDAENKDESGKDEPEKPEGAKPEEDAGKDKPEDGAGKGDEPEALKDPELEKLFQKIEDEATKDFKSARQNEELMKLVNELQSKLAEKEFEATSHKTRADKFQEKLMSSSDSENEWKLYEPQVRKLESNPKLMAMVKLWGSDNEKAKDRLVKTAAEIFEELTGEDPMSVLDERRKASVVALTRKSSPSAPSGRDNGGEAESNDEAAPESASIMNY